MAIRADSRYVAQQKGVFAMFKQFVQRVLKDRKGAALVEYAILLAGVVLVALAAVAVFGHKTTDMIAAVASILPGAHADDNGPITSGKLIETTTAASGAIEVDVATIVANTDTERLGNRMGLNAPISTLVLEP
jgi:Flp pilus assembly pilin Flp